MSILIKKAVRRSHPLRAIIYAPSGGGKTLTSLRVASGYLGIDLKSPSKTRGFDELVVLDTERTGADMAESEVYVGEELREDKACFSVMRLDGDTPQTDYRPENFIKAIQGAEEAGFKFLIIDSFSHAWTGKGGILDQKAEADRKESFSVWSDLTPRYDELIGAILDCKMSVILTVREKKRARQEVVNNKTVITSRFEMVCRDGLEFEFRFAARMNHAHELFVEKTRYSELENMTFRMPGQELGRKLRTITDAGTGGMEGARKSAVATMAESDQKRAALSALIQANVPKVEDYLRKTKISGFILEAGQSVEELPLRVVEVILSKPEAFMKAVAA